MTMPASDSHPPQPASAVLPWVRRWWWTLFLTVPAFGILGVGAAVWWLDREGPTYENEAILVRESFGPNALLGEEGRRLVSDHLAETAAALDLAGEWQIAPDQALRRAEAALRVRAWDHETLQLVCRESDPSVAAVLVNALATRLTKEDSDERLPRFRSRVVLQMLRDGNDWSVASRGARLQAQPANFIATQSAVLASKETLYEVVDALDLTER